MEKYKPYLPTLATDKELTLVDTRILLFLVSNEGKFDGKQYQLANEIGFSRTAINLALQRLKKRGYVSLRKMTGTKCKKITLRGGAR